MANLLERMIFHNFPLKLLSLGLAVGLWLAVNRDPIAEVALNVPIEFHNIPENLEINSEKIAEAQVRVRGPERVIQRVRSADVNVFIELLGAGPGERTFDLTAHQVRLPPDVDLVEVVPSQFHLSLDTRSLRQVEVRPRVMGQFAAGLGIARVLATPGVVTISGPRSRVDQVMTATTDPIDASGVVTSQTFSSNVYVADPLIQVVHPVPIQVTVIMEKAAARAGGH